MKCAILISLKNINYSRLFTRFCLDMYCEGGEMKNGSIFKDGKIISAKKQPSGEVD